jgi:putative glutamine amidotransferase
VSAPRIGISGITRQWQGAARTGVNAAYVQSVVLAGGIPLVLSPIAGAAYASAAAGAIDALVLTGGEDLDPSWYGAPRNATVTTIDRDRDLFELALYGAARHLQLPVLAICRGLQLVNVAHGGTLIQDLPTLRPSAINHNAPGERHDRVHGVTATPGSLLASLSGSTDLRVNSFHHQAIDQVGAGLAVVGLAEDGIIEAVQHDSDGPWLLGMQWHPEEMWAEPDAPERRLFEGLVAAASR